MATLRELYDNFRRTRRFHPKGLIPPVLGEEMSSPLEKQAEAFFDEMEKIALSPVVSGALTGAGFGLLNAGRNEYKERAKDVRLNLSPEDLKTARSNRMKAHALTVAGGSLFGGTVGALTQRQISRLKTMDEQIALLKKHGII